MGSNGIVYKSESSSAAASGWLSSSQPAWEPSSHKIAIHRPRRDVKPSIYNQSPFVNPRSKIRVSNDEVEIYEALLSLGENGKHNR
jgi:hypothetical protein